MNGSVLRRSTLLLFLIPTCAVAQAPASGEWARPRADWHRKFAAELAHYQYDAIPEGFPEDPVGLFNSWVNYTIRPDARPSPEAPRLAHRSDGDTCDTIGVMGAYDKRPMRLVQTFFFFVVAIDIGEREFESAEAAGEFVSQVAKSLFTEGDRVRLEVKQGPDGRYHGRQDTVWADAEDAWTKRTWFDTLKWWLDPGELRLIFVKTYPEYGRFPYPGRRSNRFWFRMYETQPQREE